MDNDGPVTDEGPDSCFNDVKTSVQLADGQ